MSACSAGASSTGARRRRLPPGRLARLRRARAACVLVNRLGRAPLARVTDQTVAVRYEERNTMRVVDAGSPEETRAESLAVLMSPCAECLAILIHHAWADAGKPDESML
jgi:hypothetical protein